MINKYPHIEKPWMKFYENIKEIDNADPKVCLTSYLKMLNINNGKEAAQAYYGDTITFGEFWEKVDIASAVLTAVGVQKGDIILNLVPNIPESGQLFLGAVQIGAVSDYIDPRPDSMDPETNARKVLEIVKREKATYIIALDMCYLGMIAPLEKEFVEEGIKKVILVSSTDSMSKSGQKSYISDVKNYNKLRNLKLPKGQRISSFKAVRDKMKQASEMNKRVSSVVKKASLDVAYYKPLMDQFGETIFTVDENADNIVYIGHTSGTSGSMPKPITATNAQSISHLTQLKKSACEYNPGETCLQMLPFFAPFGMYDNFLNPIQGGTCCITVPEFDISEIGYLLMKYHPNTIMATPAWLVGIAKCSYLQGEDLSFLKTIIYGGDSMSPYDEEIVNDFLKQNGCKSVIEKGFGMSETLGCASYAKNEYNLLSSIGIPMSGTVFAIIDPEVDDKLVPLAFSEEDVLEGELAISSDAITSGKLEDEIIVPHFELDGRDYIRTRDIVYMNKDGVVFHQARKDRTFVRFDGYKYKPFEVENEVLKHPDVANAMIVEYYEENRNGFMPICHVVLKPDTTKTKRMIVEEIIYDYIIKNSNMTSRQIPSKFRFRDSIPQTKNGKGNFNILREEGCDGTEINVDVAETNINVDAIKIY